MIPSRNFLKQKVLREMTLLGKIEKDAAHDMPKNSRAGWKINPAKAFKNTDPVILSQMKPLPKISRKDYLEYLKNNDIELNFTRGDENRKL